MPFYSGAAIALFEKQAETLSPTVTVVKDNGDHETVTMTGVENEVVNLLVQATGALSSLESTLTADQRFVVSLQQLIMRDIGALRDLVGGARGCAIHSLAIRRAINDRDVQRIDKAHRFANLLTLLAGSLIALNEKIPVTTARQ